jgi:hypothetical protein
MIRKRAKKRSPPDGTKEEDEGDASQDENPQPSSVSIPVISELGDPGEAHQPVSTTDGAQGEADPDKVSQTNVGEDNNT